MDIGYTESMPMNQPCHSNNAAATISLAVFEFRSACDSTGARDKLAMLVQDNRAQKVTIQTTDLRTQTCVANTEQSRPKPSPAKAEPS